MARVAASNRQPRISPQVASGRLAASGRVSIDGTPPVPPTDYFLLLEDGFKLLLETGDKLILES
jgi:hypothetical protein